MQPRIPVVAASAAASVSTIAAFSSAALSVAALVCAAFLSAAPLRAQACTQGPPFGLGTVTPIATTCGTGSLPRTTCRTLRVDCAGLPPIEVRVRVTEPAPGVPIAGTVLFGTGGGGNDFYGDRPGGPEIFTAMLDRGFRCVDRAWVGEGWFKDPFSVRKQSCRYATLLAWVHANVHTGGAFCATGNSGGSAELGYALTTWSSGDLLDVAVPSGGPPMSRLDKLCGLDPTWNNACRAIAQLGVFECGRPGCTVQPGGDVCTNCTTTPTAADLEADSVLHPGAVLAYPRTRVHVVLGGRDCSSAAPAGILFFQAVTSEKVLEIAAGAPHWVAQTAEGQAAIVRALLAGAACRPGPATLNAPSWPQPGGSLLLSLHGPAAQGWALALGFGAGLWALPPFGWWLLDGPVVIAGNGPFDAGGRATWSVGVPNDTALIGFELFGQALAGLCLSNLLRVVVLQ